MNSVQKHLCSLATLGLCLMVTNTRAAAQQSQPCSFLVSPQHLNTAEGSNVTSIGQLDNRPYIVLITTDLEARLPIVQTCIPDSFVTSSRLGSYIRVASLDNYWDAKALADHMSDVLDMQVRVIHENRLRP